MREIESGWEPQSYYNLSSVCERESPSGNPIGKALVIIKADRPHPPDYPHKPPDYRYTDKVYGLIIVLLAPDFGVFDLCCTRQAEPLISTATHHKFDLDI